MQRRKLTPEEKRKKYAYLYEKKMAVPDQELLKCVNNRISDDKVLNPQNIENLLKEDPKNDLIGWNVSSDGLGYVSSKVEMPGVSIDMLIWWFAWHPLESLRYMIWYPERHFSIEIGMEDRKKILDPEIPVTEKVAGVTHFIQEDSRENDSLKQVPPAFCIYFRHLEEIGISLEEVGYPDKGIAFLASPPVAQDGSLPLRPRIMFHYARATQTGVTFYSKFWMNGYILKDGKAYFVGPGTPVSENAPKALLLHCIREYTNLASFLPELYHLMDGKIEG